MVFGSRLEPTNDAEIAALDQRISHLFEGGVHLAILRVRHRLSTERRRQSISATGMRRFSKPRVSVAGGLLMLDFLFGEVSSVREETHSYGSRGGFCDARR